MSYLSNFNFDLRGPKDGPKLVFLHGLMGSWTNWRRIVSSFDSHYNILSYDQRGHGRSFRVASGYRPEDYADDLRLILDELEWGQIHLVGHSMGGRNAIVFASHYPQRLSKLVIEDIGPNGSEESIRNIEAILNKVPTPFHDKRVAKETILSSFSDQVLANYLYSNIAEVAPGVFDWRFSKSAVIESVREGRNQDRWMEWEKIQTPTLLIRGQNSQELPQNLFEEMLNRQPFAQGVVIPDSDHWVHFDQPHLFIDALKKFL